MTRFGIRSVVLALSIVLGVVACSGGAAETLRTKNLIGPLRASVVTAGAIDVGSPAAARQQTLGWHSGEGDRRNGWRAWAKGYEASLWMIVDPPQDGILWVRAAPPAYLPDQTLEVSVDGQPLGEQTLKPGMQWLAYPVRASQLAAGHVRVGFKMGQASSPFDAGAGPDKRGLSLACEWVLLTPKNVQPAARVAELRARAAEREVPEGWRMLPGDLAYTTFAPGTALGLEFDYLGDTLSVEIVERGTDRIVHSSRHEGGSDPKQFQIDLRDASRSELALRLALRADDEPVVFTGVRQRAPMRPWNLVLIVVDTLRADVLLDAEGRYDTPGLDAFAEEAIVFPSAFAHAPMTLPSHTALFTSRLPHQSGIVNNWQDVGHELPLLSEWITRYKYDARAVLSLGTLWNEKKNTSVDRGFAAYDTGPDDMAKAPFTEDRLRGVVDELSPTEPFYLFAHFSDPHEPYNTRREHRVAKLKFNGEELATLATSDMTVWKRDVTLQPGRNELDVASEHDFMAKHLYCTGPDGKLQWSYQTGELRKRGKQLVAAVENSSSEAVQARLNIWVHDVPDADGRRQRYQEEVAFVDESIDAFLEHLDGHGLLEDSLVIFTSDHGEALGERGSWGHVETLKDEMIHVPLAIRPPAGHPDAATLRAKASTLVQHVDLVPTILDLFDLPPMPGQTGNSLLVDAERVLISETHRPEASRDKICMRDERYKMIYVAAGDGDAEPERIEMYDLEADPGELVNVFDAKRSERPDWETTLRDLHAFYQLNRGEVDLDEATLERLRAMGYMGG